MELLTAVPPALVLLAVALAVPFLGRRAGHVVGFLATGAAVPWALTVATGTYHRVTFLGFDAALVHVDATSRLMVVIFGLIGATAVLYSWATDADATQTGLALSYVATSVGAVLAGDWLTLVFFWELMAVTSTLLVWHYGGPAVRAGFRYALVHAIGGSLLMAAVLWHYVAVDTFLFAAVAGGGRPPGIVAGVPAILAALGIGVNVGFVGVHAWLPDTYPRPHVAASVFLCVYTTKTGVYAMFRAFPDGNLWIAYMGGAMAVVGVFYALLQDDMRRLLSYHIQSQVGYMIAGVGIGTALATAGGFAHVYNHILYKSLLFMTAGVIIARTGDQRLSELGGLGRKMPITAVAFTIAALSIAGFPGFNGFVSKGMVVAAAHKEQLEVLRVLLLLGGVGTFLSFAKFGYYAFLHGPYEGSVRDANRGQAVAMLSIAALCVAYGLVPDLLFGLLPGTGASEAHPFTTGHLLEGVVLAALGVGGFVLLKSPLSRVGHVPDVDAVYLPLGFFAARGSVLGVTEAYAAVDRLAGRGCAAVGVMVRDPVASLPSRLRTTVGAGDTTDDTETSIGHPLRTPVGISVLVLAVVVSVVLGFLLV